MVVEDPAVRERLLPFAWKQRQVVDASHFVVFAARRGLSLPDVERHLQRIAQVRGVTRESLNWYADRMAGFFGSPPPGFDVDDWAARQTYLALGFFLEACAVLGVDSVPMEGLEPAKFDELLGLPAQGYGTVVAADIPITTAGNVYFRVVSLAFDGTNFLIAWRTATGSHIRATRVSRTGATLTSLDGAGGFVIASAGGDFYPWVTFGSGQFLVAWHGWGASGGLDIFAARVSTAGVVLDPEGFVVNTSSGDGGISPLPFSLTSSRGVGSRSSSSAWFRISSNPIRLI